MPARARPTARRIELGYELRELRKQADLTLEEAVHGLPLSDTKLYRVETGLQDLRNAGDLRKLLSTTYARAASTPNPPIREAG